MKTYFAKGKQQYDVEKGSSEWLYLNNFGYYRDSGEDIPILRPYGRKDYQLIYVASGSVTVNEKTPGDGSFVLYLPDEPQEYCYHGGEGSLYYWVHFTGSRVEELLTRYGLRGGIGRVGTRSAEVKTLLQLLTDATKSLSKGEGEAYAVSLLYALLLLLARPDGGRYPFQAAIRLLEQPEEEQTVERLADSYGMSVGHFIRSFKKTYGVTPADYRIRAQIRLAQNLLEDTALPVGSVAEQCGFSDSLYFSRLFKKRTGVSPTAFRNARRG